MLYVLTDYLWTVDASDLVSNKLIDAICAGQVQMPWDPKFKINLMHVLSFFAGEPEYIKKNLRFGQKWKPVEDFVEILLAPLTYTEDHLMFEYFEEGSRDLVLPKNIENIAEFILNREVRISPAEYISGTTLPLYLLAFKSVKAVEDKMESVNKLYGAKKKLRDSLIYWSKLDDLGAEFTALVKSRFDRNKLRAFAKSVLSVDADALHDTIDLFGGFHIIDMRVIEAALLANAIPTITRDISTVEYMMEKIASHPPIANVKEQWKAIEELQSETSEKLVELEKSKYLPNRGLAFIQAAKASIAILRVMTQDRRKSAKKLLRRLNACFRDHVAMLMSDPSALINIILEKKRTAQTALEEADIAATKVYANNIDSIFFDLLSLCKDAGNESNNELICGSRQNIRYIRSRYKKRELSRRKLADNLAKLQGHVTEVSADRAEEDDANLDSDSVKELRDPRSAFSLDRPTPILSADTTLAKVPVEENLSDSEATVITSNQEPPKEARRNLSSLFSSVFRLITFKDTENAPFKSLDIKTAQSPSQWAKPAKQPTAAAR